MSHSLRSFPTWSLQVLFEREKCLLPEAQVVVAQRKEIKKRHDIIEEHRQQMLNHLRQIVQLEIEVYHLRNNRVPSEKKEFVRKCPVNECRGFLSTRWKCDVCENYICSECNEIKAPEAPRGHGTLEAPETPEAPHVCDPGAVETIKLLKKDTKPCVKCGTMIFKISGCAQMWCPSCHTAFDWNTGRVETGLVHNPHFYDFQRQNGRLGRTPGDVPCGGLPTMHELNAVFHVYGRYNRPTTTVGILFYNVHRLVNHIDQVELAHDPPYNTIELRVGYLTHCLTEDEFKKKLQQMEKKREKRRDIRNILTMFSHTCADSIRQLIQDPAKITELVDILTQLRTYTNQTFETIQKRYGSAVPLISDSWELV